MDNDNIGGVRWDVALGLTPRGLLSEHRQGSKPAIPSWPCYHDEETALLLYALADRLERSVIQGPETAVKVAICTDAEIVRVVARAVRDHGIATGMEVVK